MKVCIRQEYIKKQNYRKKKRSLTVIKGWATRRKNNKGKER